MKVYILADDMEGFPVSVWSSLDRAEKEKENRKAVVDSGEILCP